MAKDARVERPRRKSEYEIRFGTNAARKGWIDLKATVSGPLTTTWEFLTATPLDQTPTNYRLKATFSTVVRNGVAHERWQHKPTQQGDARIWFYVVGKVVYLEQVHTNHPNETK